MRVLVLQHIACEPPAVYEDEMRRRGWSIDRVELDEGELVDGTAAYDAIVAMGGPMGAYDEAEHPWLAGEKALIRGAVRSGVPFFGACLGVQLLASALGAAVYPGPEPEVGVLPVELTDAGRADPVMGGLPDAFPALQWHGDTFDLPDGAVALARSDAYAHQAFRWGDVAYGVQFHLEVTDDLVDEWAAVPAYRESARRMLGEGGIDELAAAFRARAAEMQAHARTAFAAWADLAEARGTR